MCLYIYHSTSDQCKTRMLRMIWGNQVSKTHNIWMQFQSRSVNNSVCVHFEITKHHCSKLLRIQQTIKVYLESHNIPIPEFAPVTMTTFPLKSQPWSISIAVLFPSYFCLVVGLTGFSSTVNASLGSRYVVLLFIWLEKKQNNISN